MKTTALLVACAVMISTASAWEPPEKPDARAILDEARRDRIAKRYDEALQKHVWFHKNAVQCDPALTGVRVSFALSDWELLASRHPPAMAALEQARAEAADDVAAGRDVRSAFGDLAAIDRHLDRYTDTVSAFRALEARDPHAARQVAPYAIDAFVETRDFPLAARYLDADRELSSLVEAHAHLSKQRASMPIDPTPIANRLFASKAGQLVATLVLGHRREDAVRVAAAARKVTPDEGVQVAITRALEGQVPEPFISRETQRAFRAGMP